MDPGFRVGPLSQRSTLGYESSAPSGAGCFLSRSGALIRIPRLNAQVESALRRAVIKAWWETAVPRAHFTQGYFVSQSCIGSHAELSEAWGVRNIE